MTLDPRKAEQAVEKIGKPLELDTANLAEAIRLALIQRGHDPRDFVLVAFGGADPLTGAGFAEWEVDEKATSNERARIRENRHRWLEKDPEELARRYREGEIGALELIRRYGVILGWGTGELLSRTTENFRAMLRRRAVPHWEAS